MGQAKVRKNNGQYFGQPGYVQRQDLSSVLNADKLLLPNVPEHARSQIRDFLRPILGAVLVSSGECWRVAQRLMVVANSSRVQYVEGMYVAVLRDDPCAHGWNTIDGHIVDLMQEFYSRTYLYEPFKTYTLAEFTDIHKYFNVDALSSITPIVCLAGFADKYGRGYAFSEADREQFIKGDKSISWEADIFKPAADRLITRREEQKAMAA